MDTLKTVHLHRCVKQMSQELESFTGEDGTPPTGVEKRYVRRIATVLNRYRVHLLLFFGAFLVTLFTSVHYWSVQQSWTSVGFTLDDSWIHLEYARSIYEGRAWQYSPGVPSTGSTSPLWSILLSPLFLITSDTTGLIWGVLLIGFVFYVFCTLIVGKFVYLITENMAGSMLSMLAFVFVLSNTWLMLSGMEYPLFMFLLLLPLLVLEHDGFRFDVLLGVISGLAFLSRPEGVLVIMVVFPIRVLQYALGNDLSLKRGASLFLMIVTAGLIVLPWILYCYSVTGLPLPDTFYLKVAGTITDDQVEAWNIFWNFFLSAMPFLIIGFIAGGLTLIIKKPYPWLLGSSLTLLYRFKMPYQALINNSRYLTPIFGLIAIAAIAGFVVFLREMEGLKPKINKSWWNAALVVFIVGLIIIPSISLYNRQADVYGQATKNINEMQVDIGYWVRENTPKDAVLAIVDVGAIRFIGNRSIIDLVGLTTPDIAHGNFSGPELVQYLQNESTDYLIIFGKWTGYFYYYMPDMLVIRYRIDLQDNLICGDDTMIVFEIMWV